MGASVRANVAKVVYDVWKDQGQPQTIAAHDVWERYRQEIGYISPKLLGEELYLMEDDSGLIPFLRVPAGNMVGELGHLRLTEINAERLLTLMDG
jgi:hypothetical protein